MRQLPARTSQPSCAPHAPAARARPADRQGAVRAACGHIRYTKGCDICALTGIYEDHISRSGITPAERSEVVRLYLASDKAGLFKLWQAWQREDSG
jgi:hypothetical protein